MLKEVLILYMVIPGRINFLQLGRYGLSCESRFRGNYSREFDWLSYNLSLSRKIFTGVRKAIAIDPSFITKSGKHTPWAGYFWSGCAGAVKRGLEILGIGLIDVDSRDCLSLQTVQTPDSITLKSRGKTLMDWYLAVLKRFRTNYWKLPRTWLLMHIFLKVLLPQDFAIWDFTW